MKVKTRKRKRKEKMLKLYFKGVRRYTTHFHSGVDGELVTDTAVLKNGIEKRELRRATRVTTIISDHRRKLILKAETKLATGEFTVKKKTPITFKVFFNK